MKKEAKVSFAHEILALYAFCYVSEYALIGKIRELIKVSCIPKAFGSIRSLNIGKQNSENFHTQGMIASGLIGSFNKENHSCE